MTAVFSVLYYSVDQGVGAYRDVDQLYEEIKFEFERNMRMEVIVNWLMAA